MSVASDRSVVFFSTPVSFTNISDLHDITEILLKVTLNTINQNLFVHIEAFLYYKQLHQIMSPKRSLGDIYVFAPFLLIIIILSFFRQKFIRHISQRLLNGNQWNFTGTLSTMSRCADYFGIFKMATVAMETAKMLKNWKPQKWS